MASFLPDLWTSIFTAGPTPTLLLATNVTFAALQLVLLLLLLATQSLHFVALSLICGGLWWAINWFAAEVKAVRRAEEEEKEKEKERERREREGSVDDEGERTEVEGEVEGEEGRRRGSLSLSGFEEGRVDAGGAEGKGEAAVRRRKNNNNTGSSNVQSGGPDLSGEISTDSEWEKVEDGR